MDIQRLMKNISQHLLVIFDQKLDLIKLTLVGAQIIEVAQILTITL